MNNFSEVYTAVQGAPPKTIALAGAHSEDALAAVAKACTRGLANAILVGDEPQIRQIAAHMHIDLTPFTIQHQPSAPTAALQAVELVSSGKADILMKGMVESADFLRAVLHPKIGLRIPGRIIGTIAVVQMPAQPRFLLLTDCGFIPQPDLEAKKALIQNAVEVAKKLGIKTPKVGVLCAAETVNPKIACTVDAARLQQMNETGEITGCVVAGPISLDLAISEKAALHKKYTNPVGGNADILIMPNVETGNTLYKSMVYFGNTTPGTVMAGTRAPVVFTSRADSAEVKLNAIALALYLAGK